MASPSVSRRSLLKKGAAAAVAGSAALVGGAPRLAAQSSASSGRNLGPNVAGRKFKALVSTGFGPNTTKLTDLTLLPIAGRQVVIETEVSQCCYTMCARVMGTQ